MKNKCACDFIDFIYILFLNSKLSFGIRSAIRQTCPLDIGSGHFKTYSILVDSS